MRAPAMSRRALAALGAVELAALVLLAWVPEAHRFPWPGLPIFGGAFAAYTAAAWGVTRTGSDDGTLIWIFGIAMRLALLPLAPELSDDIYRYLWDGHVQLAGTNPYLHAPGAAAVEHLRTAYHGLINNPSVPTIYPPLAQVVFLAIAAAGSTMASAKLVWVACDLATAAVLAGVARDTGRDPTRVLLLYLWAPLLVVEVAWSGHLEPLGLLMLALAIRAAHRAWSPGRAEALDRQGDQPETAPSALARPNGLDVRAVTRLKAAAGGALALSALTKFAPAAALPALVRRFGWRPAIAFGAVVLVLYAPYAPAGAALFSGLRTYSEHWWFMKGAFGVLEAVAGDPATARAISAVAVVSVIGWTALAGFDLERALLWTLGAGMILTPTLHPWYVLWMLPMAALRGSRAWILLCGLAFIGYYGLSGYQEGGEWAQPGVARAALWLPFFVVLMVDVVLSRRVPKPLAQCG